MQIFGRQESVERDLAYHDALRDLMDWAMLLIDDKERAWDVWMKDTECFLSEYLIFGDNSIELNNLVQKVCRIVTNHYLEKTKALQRFSPFLVGTVIDGHDLYFHEKYTPEEREQGVRHKLTEEEQFLWDTSYKFIHVVEDPFQSYLTNNECEESDYA